MKEREAANVHMRAANKAFSEGQTEDAIRLYRETLKIMPTRIAGWSNLGVTLHSAGRLLEAIESYAVVGKLHPTHDTIYLNMGDAYRQAGRPQEAVTSYRYATKAADSQQACRP